jgi:hypothetical protein
LSKAVTIFPSLSHTLQTCLKQQHKTLIMDANVMLMNILVPLGGMAMIFGIVYLYKRENLAMIEKGMNPKIYRPAPYSNLKYGLLLMGSGIGLLLAYLIDMASTSIDGDENPSIYFALIAIFGGLGLVLSYRIEKKEVLEKSIE